MSRHVPIDVLIGRLELALEDARLVAMHGSTAEQRGAAVEKCQQQLRELREAV